MQTSAYSRSSRPIRLVVLLEQDNSTGGGYQQAINAALLLKGLPSDLCNVTFVTTCSSSIEDLQQRGIEARYFPIQRWQRLFVRLRISWRQLNIPPVLPARFSINYLDRFLSEIEADLVYFTYPSHLSLVTENYSFLFTLWDLSHRDEVDFPEVRVRGEFERRENLYTAALKKATGIVVDSQAGRDNAIRRYGVDFEKVHVVPFSPAVGTQLSDNEYQRNYVDIRARYDMPFDYVYYPAQFWPHKNHVYLLRGLRALEDRYGMRVGAIFSGRDFGNMAHVQAVSEELGLMQRVRFAGFVPDSEVAYLYRQSIALVMPTYFGPTNLPPLEAFTLGVPVLYSDPDSLRDQIGDAGLLMDLTRPESMAENLYRLVTEPALAPTLVGCGKHRLMSLTDAQRLEPLRMALEKFRARRLCWGDNPWTPRDPKATRPVTGRPANVDVRHDEPINTAARTPLRSDAK
ncbi:glycosyltransferase family 1 protein [Caballeronia sp. Lep1P3]|uniref:glycosyltransferase family 4 protein n=1 Tax=Caballeronia sp. Lep1P3 TaxID=2878150 RepID=UPI001FD5D799|nr:glycosyltransferase family 1 protein [Caballeronia sp. Lep1P3]